MKFISKKKKLKTLEKRGQTEGKKDISQYNKEIENKYKFPVREKLNDKQDYTILIWEGL